MTCIYKTILVRTVQLLSSSVAAAAAGNKSGQPLLSPSLASSPELLTMMAAAAATATTFSLNLQGSSSSAPNALAPNPLSLLLGAAMGAATGSGRAATSTSGAGVNGTSGSSANKLSAVAANGAGRVSASASHSALTGRPQSLSSAAAVSPTDGAQGHARRTRTQLSAFQVAVLSAVYSTHKCPSVRECGILGDELGLPGRVVQVRPCNYTRTFSYCTRTRYPIYSYGTTYMYIDTFVRVYLCPRITAILYPCHMVLCFTSDCLAFYN